VEVVEVGKRSLDVVTTMLQLIRTAQTVSIKVIFGPENECQSLQFNARDSVNDPIVTCLGLYHSTSPKREAALATRRSAIA
jgi:hypothetical protein